MRSSTRHAQLPRLSAGSMPFATSCMTLVRRRGRLSAMPRPFGPSTQAVGVPVCLTSMPRQIIAGPEFEFSPLGEWTEWPSEPSLATTAVQPHKSALLFPHARRRRMRRTEQASALRALEPPKRARHASPSAHMQAYASRKIQRLC